MSKKFTLLLTCLFSILLIGNVQAALVGQWNFDDSTANDSSGNSHNGTLTGGATIVYDANRAGNVLSLDGTDDYVLVSGYKGILGTNSRTISAWIKTTKTGTAIQGIMSWGKNTTNLSWDFVVYDSKLRQMAYSKDRYGSTALANGNWHHVASVYAGGNLNTVKLYVDGLLETVTGDASAAINTTSSRDVKIGNTDSLSNRFFKGMIDDVRLFDTALTDVEVRTLSGNKTAYNFSPANDTVTLPTVLLDWDSVAVSPQYRVYLSSTFSDVNSRTVTPVLVSDSTYTTGALSLDTKYYWTVDVNAGGTIYPAKTIMNFTTAKPYAYNPSPVSGAKYMPLTTSKLSWTVSNIMVNQNVYFSTDSALVTAKDPSVKIATAITDSNCTITGPLADGATYYWLVDTNSDAGLNSLGLWSFTVASIAEPNLVAWWAIDNDDNVAAYVWDHSGNGHHAAKKGTPSTVNDSLFGNVMSFPGTAGSYLNAGGGGTNGWANFAKSITYCAWFKVDKFTSSMQCLIGNSGSYRISRNGTTRKMRLWHDNSDRGTLVGTSDVNDNQWHHGCGVVDSNGTAIKVTLYIDGIAENTKTYTGSLMPMTADLIIGADGVAYPGREWKGLVDDVRIYNKALTQYELWTVAGINPPLDDLMNVVNNWLSAGPAGDLNSDHIVDMRDFNTAVKLWGWDK